MNAYRPISVAPQSPLAEAGALVDLPAMWAIFRRRFRLFVATLLTVLALVTIVTFQLTPTYDASARVVLNARETQALDVSAIIAGISPDAAVVDTEVEIIRSRSMAAKVADALNLYTEAEFNTSLDQTPGIFARFLPGQLATKEKPSERLIRERTIDRIIDAIRVERAGITYAIAITATSKDPEMAARLANGFADQYIVDQLDQKFETYSLVNEYLEDAVQENRETLRIAEDAVERYRTDNGLLTAEGTLLSEQQISDLQAQLIIQQADLAERRAKLTTVNRRLSLGAGVEAISDVLASPVIAALRAKQADLARRRSDLETRYGPRHPQIDNINSEEADLQAQLDSEVDRIVARLRNDVDVARQRVRSLNDSISDLKNSLFTDNKALVRLRELEREAQVSRRNYEQLLERSQQAALFEDLAEADARVADPASLPTEAAFPNKMLNLLLGIVLGGAVGGLMIVLAEVFDSGLRTAEDVERALGTGLVSLVPQLSSSKMTDGKMPQDYLVDRPLSSFAESYRTLRSAVALHGGEDTGTKVVALTSAISGEGKTVSALCLGRIAALSGDKVIVVDCDVRRRILSAQYDDEDVAATGLAEVLEGTTPLKAAIRTDEASGLHILPVAEDRSGMGDLFGTKRFDALLGKLRDKYDLVLLDTAPLTAVADTRRVVDTADLAVQFVAWKKTPLAVAKTARKILADLGTPLAGVVLTQVDMRAQSGYGYEGSYKYYAQHGKYYFD
ncbi:MAG: polysaccharide biosynthesis tyrosine autokinase [Pseudomonadota bacterium]